jgi:hypothetical protein
MEVTSTYMAHSEQPMTGVCCSLIEAFPWLLARGLIYTEHDGIGEHLV